MPSPIPVGQKSRATRPMSTILSLRPPSSTARSLPPAPSTTMPTDDSTSANKPPPSLKNGLLCTIHEAESWQLENQYLIGHYRTASHSYRACLASLGYLHNQTSNIYTHLVGAALFLSWAVQTYNDVLQRYPTSDFNDFLAFGVFFACALFCFGSSALFHLFMYHSERVNQIWLLFDLFGVFALIIATIFSGTFYAFYCERFWWKVYSAGVRICLLVSAHC